MGWESQEMDYHLVGGAALPQKEQIFNLKVLLDSGLLLNQQVAVMFKDTIHQLWLVSHPSPFLGRKDLVTAVHVLVIIRLDYCNALYARCP